MTKPTIASLQAHIVTLTAERDMFATTAHNAIERSDALTTQLHYNDEVHGHNIDALKAEIATLKAIRGPKPAYKPNLTPAQLSAHQAYRLKCDTARAEAMATGKSTLVA